MPESQQLATAGFTLVPDVLTDAECERLAARVTSSASVSGGTRNFLEQTWCRHVVDRIREDIHLQSLLPRELVAVQCTYFQKSSSSNWLVPIHQDLSIPVAARVDDSALAGWSEKEGVVYVQPPLSVLQHLLAIRLHLDDCADLDGPLRVLPGSHLMGRIEPEAAAAARRTSAEVVCVAGRGSALAMRPLLLHSSPKASGTSMRRVLHFLFGPRDLPLGLRWKRAV